MAYRRHTYSLDRLPTAKKSSLHSRKRNVQAAFALQNLLKSVPLIFHAFQAA